MAEDVSSSIARINNFIRLHFSDDALTSITNTTTAASWMNVNFRLTDNDDNNKFLDFPDWGGDKHLLKEIKDKYNSTINVNSNGNISFNANTGIISLIGTYKIDLSILCSPEVDGESENKLKINIGGDDGLNVVKTNNVSRDKEFNLSLHEVIVCNTIKELKIKISTESGKPIKINYISMSIYRIY